MNILGFTSMFLFMLGITFAYLQRDAMKTASLQNAYIGYSEATRDAQNKIEKSAYDTLHKSKAHLQKSSTKAKKENSKDVVAKHFKQENSPYCARVNLALLLENAPSEKLYSFMRSLLDALYGENLLSGLSTHDFLFEILSALKREKDEVMSGHISLAQLELSEKWQPVFYQMLKGNSAKKIPSLLDYCKIEPSQHRGICFACVDHVMLTTLVGEKIATTLETAKETPLEQITMNRQKMEQLLSEKHIPIEQTFLTLVRYTHNTHEKPPSIHKGYSKNITVTKRKI